MPHPINLISLEHVPVAAGGSVVGQGYGSGLRKLLSTPSVHIIELHPKKVVRQGVLVGP